MPITPKALQDILDELKASRASRKRAWEVLQEIRWVLKDTTGIDLPAPARKTIDLEGSWLKTGSERPYRNARKSLEQNFFQHGPKRRNRCLPDAYQRTIRWRKPRPVTVFSTKAYYAATYQRSASRPGMLHNTETAPHAQSCMLNSCDAA